MGTLFASQSGEIYQALTPEAGVRCLSELQDIISKHATVTIGEYAILFTIEDDPELTSDRSRISWAASIIEFSINEQLVRNRGKGIAIPHDNQPFRSLAPFAELDIIEITQDDIDPNFDPTPYNNHDH